MLVWILPAPVIPLYFVMRKREFPTQSFAGEKRQQRQNYSDLLLTKPAIRYKLNNKNKPPVYQYLKYLFILFFTGN